MKAAIIKDGIVTNIAKVADAEYAEAQGWIVSDTARIGDSYDAETGEFVTPPKYASLADAQADKLQEINAAYTAAAQPLVKEYPEVETKSWDQQKADAEAYLSWHETQQGDPPQMMVLDKILAGRNGDDGTETLHELCLAVQRNAAAFAEFQLLTGKRQRLAKLARAAETLEALEAIQW